MGRIARNVHVLLLVVRVTVLAVHILDDVLGRGARNVHVLLLVRAAVLVVRNLDNVLGHGVQQVAHPVARVLPRRDPDIGIIV